MEAPASNPQSRFTPQVLFGVLVIVAGVLFTLDNLGIVDAEQFIQYWPAGLVAIGLLKLWDVREGRGWLGGFFLVLLGGWMLLEHVVAIRISVGDLWPLFFVFLGGYMVWRGIGGHRRTHWTDSTTHLSALAVMSGIVRGSNSTNFEGGDLTAIMGGCEIDLRQAAIAADEAVIETFAFWGGIEIRVPESWTIVTRVTPLMGGVDDQTRPAPNPAAKRLVIRGFVVMGGVVVKN
ncbi:MAG: hypothetical protein DMF84_15890 [Acidobacteria bacterium]|nr:MAG: hypothetical protein DMF84_15890 [Acidobacteriota bacterium]